MEIKIEAVIKREIKIRKVKKQIKIYLWIVGKRHLKT